MWRVGFYMPKHGCCGCYLSSKGRFICVEHSAGTPRLHNTGLEQSLPELLLHWGQCQDVLLMICFQLLVVCDLSNDSVWCMHGVSNLACPNSGCVIASSNLRQQHPPPPFTTMSYSMNHSLLTTDLWKQMCCRAEIASHKNVLDVTAELLCHFHLPH